MKIPPIDWHDLHACGLPAGASITNTPGGCVVEPPPPRLVAKLLAAATASPPPDHDRMAYLRHVRDLLMSITDYTQAADSPLSAAEQAAWATYRQALRDLPSTYSGEGPIPWPAEPA